MGRIARGTRFKVLMAAEFTCQYCGRKAPDVVLEVDHVVPKSKGGSNRRENLTVACFDCNRGKRDRVLPQPTLPAPPPTSDHADVLMCADGCPYCLSQHVNNDETTWAVLPVRIEHHGRNGYAMWYRCARGHSWSTYWDEYTAKIHAEDILAEGVRTYPDATSVQAAWGGL